MEYESHFTGKEAKAAGGQGVQARAEPVSTDSKAEGLLLSVVASAVRTVALFPGAPVSLPPVQALSMIA